MPYFLHFLLFSVSLKADLGNWLLLAAVMTSDDVSGINIKPQFSQLVVPLDECLHVVSLDAEDGVVHDTFMLRPVVLVSIQLGTLLDILLDEFVFKSRHCLLNLVLRGSGSVEPRVLLNFF